MKITRQLSNVARYTWDMLVTTVTVVLFCEMVLNDSEKVFSF